MLKLTTNIVNNRPNVEWRESHGNRHVLLDLMTDLHRLVYGVFLFHLSQVQSVCSDRFGPILQR